MGVEESATEGAEQPPQLPLTYLTRKWKRGEDCQVRNMYGSYGCWRMGGFNTGAFTTKTERAASRPKLVAALGDLSLGKPRGSDWGVCTCWTAASCNGSDADEPVSRIASGSAPCAGREAGRNRAEGLEAGAAPTRSAAFLMACGPMTDRAASRRGMPASSCRDVFKAAVLCLALIVDPK